MKSETAMRDGQLVIEDVIQDLAAQQAWLSEYIQTHMEELETTLLIRLLNLHGQNAARLGKLLRDQHTLSGKAANGISVAMEQAMVELSLILGTDLTKGHGLPYATPHRLPVDEG
jgi:hypothetical protein